MKRIVNNTELQFLAATVLASEPWHDMKRCNSWSRTRSDFICYQTNFFLIIGVQQRVLKSHLTLIFDEGTPYFLLLEIVTSDDKKIRGNNSYNNNDKTCFSFTTSSLCRGLQGITWAWRSCACPCPQRSQLRSFKDIIPA